MIFSICALLTEPTRIILSTLVEATHITGRSIRSINTPHYIQRSQSRGRGRSRAECGGKFSAPQQPLAFPRPAAAAPQAAAARLARAASGRI